jgi:hypothetical protein
MVPVLERKGKLHMSFKKATAPAKAPGNPPIAKFQDGLVSVSVWENTSDKGTFYSVNPRSGATRMKKIGRALRATGL